MQKIKDLINNPRNLKIISAILVIVCLVSVASSYGNGSTISEAAAQEAATQAASAESSTAPTEVSSSSGSSSGGGEVCITQTGAKYHHSSCSTLSRSKNLRYMSTSEAKAAGYEACKVRNP